MLDVFTEEIEVIIKDGIANLYWYRVDLAKALIRCKVDSNLANSLLARTKVDGNRLTKREIMDALYAELRTAEPNHRIEVSRHLVSLLIQRNDFVPQDPKHRIEIAERCALKLREISAEQQREKERRERTRREAEQASQNDYFNQLSNLEARFRQARVLPPQRRGYELEKIITELMRVSGLSVEEPFRTTGEQIDGAIKYDGNYYLLELKWTTKPTETSEIGLFYYKVDGKFAARGLFISMSGYTSGADSVPRGKEIKVLLLDGVHLANVLSGVYSVQALLDHAIKYASLKGQIFPPHQLDW